MQLTVTEWTRAYQSGIAYRILLNGRDVTRNDCIFADEEAGIARFFERDFNGHIRVNPKKPDEPRVLTRRGKVEIVKQSRAEWDAANPDS